MSFDIEAVLKDMVSAIDDAVKDELGDIKSYASAIVENEKNALEELGLARIAGEIDDETYKRELEREKKVIETELLTIEIMKDAAAQKAVNAAINTFTSAIAMAM